MIDLHTFSFWDAAKRRRETHRAVPNGSVTSPAIWHGIASKAGEVLEAYVTSRNADLLVMGAYGHSRIRDFILGGATKSMLARPLLPIFLSH